MIDGIVVVYAENDIELSWSIEPSVVHDKNETWQRCNWSYSYDLHQKWFWTVLTEQTGYDLRPNNIELSWPIKLGVDCDEN